MDEGEFDIIFINNLKILEADFNFFKLPTNSAAVRNAFRSYPKPLLAQLFGFLLRKLDEVRYERLIRPLLACYNRAIDNQLKNLFHMWIKDLPANLGLIKSFSRVWSVSCPKTYCKFFAVLSSYVLEKCIERDFGNVDAGFTHNIEDNIHEYLENVSKIHSKFTVMEELSVVHQSLLPEESSNIQRECLEYAKLDQCSTNAIQNLAFHQLKCWNEVQDLKERFSSLYSKWLLMKPLYSEIASVCEEPYFVTAEDLKQFSSENGAITLSELMKKAAEMFVFLQKSLARYDDVENETSSELVWCSSFLNRLIESDNFEDQRKLNTDIQSISARLDTVISKLNEMLIDYTGALSASKSWCSGRLSGLQIGDSYADSKSRHPTSNHSPNSSSLSESLTSAAWHPHEIQLGKLAHQVGQSPSISSLNSPVFNDNKNIDVNSEAQSEFGETATKPMLKLPSFSSSPANSSLGDDDNSLFNSINSELASLLQATTIGDRCSNDENGGFGNQDEIKPSLRPSFPTIQRPLVPSRLLNTRTSLKHLRFGTQTSSEQMNNEVDAVSNENQAKVIMSQPIGDLHTSSPLKSFWEISHDGIDFASSKSPRPPLVTINSNFENNPSLSEFSSFAGLCTKSPVNSASYPSDETNKNSNGIGQDDESLGLLNLEDINDPTSDFLLSQ